MNIFYVAGIPYSDELYHHGIKGQKWGIRRFQNPDGTLTEAGMKRYNEYSNREYSAYKNDEKYDSYDAEVSRLGKELHSKVTSKMGKVISDIYDSDFSSYNGKYKKQYEKAVSEGKKLSEDASKKYETLKAQDAVDHPSAKGIKKLFTDIDKERSDSRKRINEAYESSDEYKKLEANNAYVKELKKKMSGEWKDKTINEILKEVPESKKDSVWETLRFGWWEYD